MVSVNIVSHCSVQAKNSLSDGTTGSWFKLIVKDLDDGPKGYHWSEMRFFSLWTSRQNVFICLDCPASLINNLSKRLMGPTEDDMPSPSSVLALQIRVLEHVVELYDTSIWVFSRRLRSIEKVGALIRPNHSLLTRQSQERGSLLKDTSFPTLHDLARHTAHSTETVYVASDIIARMIKHSKHLVFRSSAASNVLDIEQQIESLEFQQSILCSLTERSRSNEKRLRNEINLVRRLLAWREKSC